MSTTSPTKAGSSGYRIEVPTPNDFKTLSEMKAAAFAEKGVSESDGGRAYEEYFQDYPSKIQHCRVAKSPDDDNDEIFGAIQLQLKGDPGDSHLPAFMRHEVQPGEAYIEFIACHPNHTGKGVGSKLLEWAETFGRDHGVQFLSLEVMAANKGAIRLYERKGFVVKRDPHADECDECLAPICIFCCMGCKYCRVFYMEKSLLVTPPQVRGMVR